MKKGHIHANKLSHFDKVHCCRTIAGLPIGMVGAISNKLSLLSYLAAAKKTPTHFYNKVMQYLLERIGEASASMNVPKHKIRIVLEAREQQYSSLLHFIKRIQDTPLDTRAATIRNIDRFSITTVKKKDDMCMALSDFGAHALFCAVRRDKRSHGLSETRYLRELAPVFLADATGRIFPKGIKPIHSLSDLALADDTLDTFRNLTNLNKDYHVMKRD